MGFSYAGNLGGAGAPVVRRFQIGETMYVGQLVQTGIVGGAGGHVQLADIATDTFESGLPIIGFVSAVADASRTWTAAATDNEYGDKSTYTTTMSIVTANVGTGLTGGGEVDVTLALPMKTLIKAPIWDATYGNALPELTITTGNSDGKTITHASDATGCTTLDDYSTVYCRHGANKGHYRVVTTAGANEQVVTVPFPYTIVAGDIFVVAACVLGFGGMDITTNADGIDGDNVLDDFRTVYYHEINLEESGKEYAVFSFWHQSAEATV